MLRDVLDWDQGGEPQSWYGDHFALRSPIPRRGYLYRSSMKLPVLLIGLSATYISFAAMAQDPQPVPSFARLDAVAGCDSESDEFKCLLRDFRFSDNSKRDNSWGSGFGVFLEQSNKGIVSIGIRPPTSATSMPTYGGTLPKGLKPEDTIGTIKRKLGAPNRVYEPEEGYVVLHYTGFHVIALGGRLFELWLTELPTQAEQSDEPKTQSRRF